MFVYTWFYRGNPLFFRFLRGLGKLRLSPHLMLCGLVWDTLLAAGFCWDMSGCSGKPFSSNCQFFVV